MSVTLTEKIIAKIGDRVELTPTIDPLEEGTSTYQWLKNGRNMDSETSLSLIFDSVSQTDQGVYTISVTPQDTSTTSISTPSVLVVTDNDDIENLPVDTSCYIHNLRPARNHGFMWMGWWILDEIIKANEDGFDWINNPLDERFKYNDVLNSLSKNKNTWEDIEIQESRNGTIILLSSLA